jgi:hypothetical protein
LWEERARERRAKDKKHLLPLTPSSYKKRRRKGDFMHKDGYYPC